MRRQPLRVLLIDDNRHGTIARQAFLEEAGYKVETADSGEEGLALLAAGNFDMVVTDYRMPKVTGAQVVKAARSAPRRIPVVILSGYVKALALTEESTNADAVVPKGPRETQDLLRAILRLTRKKPASERSRAVTARKKKADSRR